MSLNDYSVVIEKKEKKVNAMKSNLLVIKLTPAYCLDRLRIFEVKQQLAMTKRDENHFLL